MSRITFIALNLTGLFLLMSLDRAEPFTLKTLLGALLLATGMLGMLAYDLFPKKKKKQPVDDDEIESGG